LSRDFVLRLILFFAWFLISPVSFEKGGKVISVHDMNVRFETAMRNLFDIIQDRS